MKKSIVFILSLIVLLSLGLSACQFGIVSNDSSNETIAQTMVALAFTQTAIAESQGEQPAVEETEAPPIVEETLAEETEAPTVEIVHNLLPSEPGWVNKWFYDTDSSKGYVTGGDDFVANLFERPFTETEMVYRPDIDINKTEMSEDSNFYYVTIYLNGQNPAGGLQGIYGIEIDWDLNGRGDLLVIADHPSSTDWDIAGVSAYKDPNHDVGGSSIMRPDSNYSGDGYEDVVFSMDVLDDPDTAWARVDLSSPPSVTIAFKKSLTAGHGTFVWGVWAAESLLDPALLDLHDNFTQTEAGSPYQSHSTYPLKAINLVDNTCRETYLFEATTPIPGLCYVPEEPTPEPSPTATETATPEPIPGTITGAVFDDVDNNGRRDADEPLTVYSIVVYAHRDSCSNPSVRMTGAKEFTFSDLEAGTYCVNIIRTGGGTDMTTPSQYTFYLGEGATYYVEFGYYVVQ
jgi:hypothetical protein